MTFALAQSAVASRRKKRIGKSQLAFILAGSITGLLLTLAIFGPWIAPADPTRTDILAASLQPGGQHLFGTDSLGRDIFSRLLVGAGLSYFAAGLIVLISTVGGTAIALFSAWNGGWVDGLITKILNVMFAVPGILVAILAVAIFGPGVWAPVIALSIVYIPYVARVVRSTAVKERKRPYVESLKLSGLSPSRIVAFHLFPNVIPSVVAQATYGFGAALLDFAAVSFLGLGIQPPNPELGVMVASGRDELLSGSFQQTFAAGSFIVITVVVFNILGGQLVSRLAKR